MQRTFLILSIFTLSVFGASLHLLFAQTSPGDLRLVTSPLPISLVSEPGQTISTELRVKNAGSRPETLRIDIMKFGAFEEEGAPRLLDREPGDDFLDWVTFSEETFTLEPEEWKTVTATFALPPSASFGYYYAFVFTRASEEESLGERETAVVGGTASLVLLEARVPNAKREITVTEFSTDRMVYEFLPVSFSVKLRNSGNVHVAPRGNIFLEKGGDKDIALLEINPGKGNILPDSARIFEESWKDGFPVYQERIEDGNAVLNERGEREIELHWNWQEASKLRFGKYKAKMLLIYDDGVRDVPIEGVVSFWVVPWRLLAGAIFIGIFFFIGMKNTLLRLWQRVRSYFQKSASENETP